MGLILGFIFAAIEALIDLGKKVIRLAKKEEDGKLEWENVSSFVLGWILFWLFGIDLLAFIGLTFAVVMPAWVYSVLVSFFGAVITVRWTGNLNGLVEWIQGLKG